MSEKVKITKSARITTIKVSGNAPHDLMNYLNNKEELYRRMAEGSSTNEFKDSEPFFPFHVPPGSGKR